MTAAALPPMTKWGKEGKTRSTEHDGTTWTIAPGKKGFTLQAGDTWYDPRGIAYPHTPRPTFTKAQDAHKVAKLIISMNGRN